MNMKKALILTAVALPLTFGAATASAFGGAHGKHKGGCEMDMGRGMIQKLDLTDAQKEQFKTLREANRDEMKNLSDAEKQTRRAERQAHHEAVQGLVLADNFDAAKAQELAKEMANKQAEKRVKMLEKQHQMLSILTPEQKSKWAELQQERAEKCQKKRAKQRN